MEAVLVILAKLAMPAQPIDNNAECQLVLNWIEFKLNQRCRAIHKWRPFRFSRRQREHELNDAAAFATKAWNGEWKIARVRRNDTTCTRDVRARAYRDIGHRHIFRVKVVNFITERWALNAEKWRSHSLQSWAHLTCDNAVIANANTPFFYLTSRPYTGAASRRFALTGRSLANIKNGIFILDHPNTHSHTQYSLDQIEQVLLFIADTVWWFGRYFAQQLR